MAAVGKRTRASGISLIELTVTLLIAAMLSVAVLTLLNHTTQRADDLEEYMARSAAIQHCLDMLVKDIVETSDGSTRVYVDRKSLGWRDSSHLTIILQGADKSGKPSRQIDWLAVAGEYEDLVLYRRDKRSTDKEKAMYIPVCQDVHSFEVELMNDRGEQQQDPNLPAPLVQVVAKVYRPGPYDPERVLTVSRTFCVNRFQ